MRGIALDMLCRYREAQHLVGPDDALAERVNRFRSLKQLLANAASDAARRPEPSRQPGNRSSGARRPTNWRAKSTAPSARNSTGPQRMPNLPTWRPVLDMMQITANYEATYADLVRFVNLIDKSSRLLVMESLNATPQQGGGKLNVYDEAGYVRG